MKSMKKLPQLRVEFSFLCPTPYGKITPYAITEGLVGNGGANMVVVGKDMDDARNLLTMVAEHFSSTNKLPVPGRIEVNDKTYALVEVNTPNALIGHTSKHGRVLQLVWPDTAGNYPWDTLASEAFRKLQPVFGYPPQCER
jgi:hypothetical protein